MSIVVVDYGMGNTFSVQSALRYLGYESDLSADPAVILSAKKIIFPGVGAFSDCVSSIKEKNLDVILNEAVVSKQIPILGICLGMQMMFDGSDEGPGAGLGWLPGFVRKIAPEPGFRVPHVGWNDLALKNAGKMFQGIKTGAHMYFTHSFHVEPRNQSDVAASCFHGKEIVAAVEHDHIWGTQFHPEKSQETGLKIFHNFMEYEKC